MSYLREFYEIMGECGLQRAPWDDWHAWASQNAELWPIVDAGHRLLGGVLFKGHTVHIAVKPEWQGRWINKRVLAAYRTWSHDVTIHAPIRAENQRARRFAERLGFRMAREEGEHCIYLKEPTHAPVH